MLKKTFSIFSNFFYELFYIFFSQFSHFNWTTNTIYNIVSFYSYLFTTNVKVMSSVTLLVYTEKTAQLNYKYIEIKFEHFL